MLNKVWKKAISLPLVLCLTVLCVVSAWNTTKVSAATNEVSLNGTQVTYTNAAGGYTSYFVSLDIKVKNIAYEKKVYAHYKDEPTNTWKDVEASFAYMLDNGYEIWTVNCPGTSTFYGDFEYCLKYEVAGQTYWDNNNWKNYITTASNKTNW